MLQCVCVVFEVFTFEGNTILNIGLRVWESYHTEQHRRTERSFSPIMSFEVNYQSGRCRSRQLPVKETVIGVRATFSEFSPTNICQG
jgi:hypothetical protein